MFGIWQHLWIICEMKQKLVMYLLPFLASPHIFFFLFSYPHFLGDRLSIKFQQESRRKLQKFGDFSCKNLNYVSDFRTICFRRRRRLARHRGDRLRRHRRRVRRSCEKKSPKFVTEFC